MQKTHETEADEEISGENRTCSCFRMPKCIKRRKSGKGLGKADDGPGDNVRKQIPKRKELVVAA